MVGLNAEEESGRSVAVALRDPASGTFSQWVGVSPPGSPVGGFISIAPSVLGRWTVAWSAPCSGDGDPGGASWVEVGPSSYSDPAAVPGSGCVSRGLELQSDRHGNQFLRLGLPDDVQLAARRHNHGFGLATTVTTGDDRTDGGFLGVSGNGQATLIWGHVRPQKKTRDDFLYVTARPGRKPSAPRRIKGLRLRRDSANDVLKEVAPLPHGSLALAFTRSWFTKHRLVRVKVGTAIWKSGTRIKRPTYTKSGLEGRFVNRIGIESSFGGSALAWWSTQTELTAKPLGFWWRARF
jgi:hypothetical protein